MSTDEYVGLIVHTQEQLVFGINIFSCILYHMHTGRYIYITTLVNHISFFGCVFYYVADGGS